MKRFVLILLSIFTCAIASAEQITINWLNEDKTTNQTTSCTIGGDVILPYTPTKYGYTFQGWLANYTPIEYLESTGTQYIDTRFYADNTSGFLIDLLMLGGADTVALGVKGAGDSRWACNPQSGGINIPWNYRSGYYCDSNVRHEISMNLYNNRSRIVDGTIKSLQLDGLNQRASDYSVYMFATKWGSNVLQDFFIGRIYKVQITKGTDLVRDFIPVLDDNGTPCMFDKVEGKFYYNQGTGQFIAGPIINE